MIMIYKLTSIPDISLSKYQNMSVGGIEGLKEYADDFLRQWQKVSAIYDIEINYIVRFVPESKKGINQDAMLYLNMKMKDYQAT